MQLLDPLSIVALSRDCGQSLVKSALERDVVAVKQLLQVIADPDLESLCEATILAPQCTVALSRDDREGFGWINGASTVLIVPSEDGYTLMVFPTVCLPLALIRLNDVRPREDHRRAPLSIDESHSVGTVLCRWRVQIRWVRPDGPRGVTELEVIDAESGYWFIEYIDAEVFLRPISPTEIFRALITLLPLDEELEKRPA